MKRHQHIFTALLICAALLVLSGCGPTGQEAKLIGSWRFDMTMATMTITFSKDHTFASTMTGLTNGSELGEWKLKGDQLIFKAKISTIGMNTVGKENPATIVKLDESVLIIRSRNEKGEEEHPMIFQHAR